MNEPLFANNFAATLQGAVAAGGTSATLLPTGTAAKIPALANGDYFPLTVTQAGDPSAESSWETLKVTSVSGDVVTFAPAVAAWAAGSKAQSRPDANWANTVKPLWRASGSLVDGTPVVVALGGRSSASSVYRTSVNPVAGDSVLVESGPSSSGPWTSWPNGAVGVPDAATSYPGTPADTHMRFTRTAGSGTTSRYYVAEISN